MSPRRRRPPFEESWERLMGYLEWQKAKWKITLPDGRELRFDPDQRTRDIFDERRYEAGFVEAVAAMSLEPDFTLERALELPAQLPLIDFVLSVVRASLQLDAPLVHLGRFGSRLQRRPDQIFTVITRADDGTRVDSDTGDFYEDKHWQLEVHAPPRMRIDIQCRREFPGRPDEPWAWSVAVHHETGSQVEPLLDAFRAIGLAPTVGITTLP